MRENIKRTTYQRVNSFYLHCVILNHQLFPRIAIKNKDIYVVLDLNTLRVKARISRANV